MTSSWVRTLVPLALPIALAGCGDDGATPPPPGTIDAATHLDGGRMDAGRDGGIVFRDGNFDARLEDDAGPPCTMDSECDDGLVCNGVETCDEKLGECVDGVLVDCEDGIPCTDDVCVEPVGSGMATCSSTANDANCLPTERCITAGSRGCIVPCATPTGFCEPTTPQCGCATSQACFLNEMTGRVCATPGSLGVGSACTMVNQCERGVGCRVLNTTTRICARFCDEDSDCVAGSLCVNEPVPTTRYCSQVCNPIAQTGCTGGSACNLYTEMGGGRGYTDCRAPVGTNGQGFPCTNDDVCGAGFACLDDGSDTSCRSYCIPGSTSCPGGTACDTVLFSVTVGATTYGACL